MVKHFHVEHEEEKIELIENKDKWFVCYQDSENKKPEWSKHSKEFDARELYDKFEKKKARIIFNNDKVKDKDGDKQMTDDMEKYANTQYSNDQFHVNPIGMKIVLFHDKLETANNTNPFYSMFNKKGKIIGTQWIPCTDRISKSYEKHGVFYQLKNSTVDDYRYESDFVKSNFFHYYNVQEVGRSRGYTVVQAMVSDLLDDNIQHFEA